MNFNALINSFITTYQVLQNDAVKAINKVLTARNWLNGFYIIEFEQNGKDRAEYGAKLLDKLAK